MGTKFKLLTLIAAVMLIQACDQQKVNNQDESAAVKPVASEPYTGKPMDGIPASPESQVTLQNWMTQPYSKWAFRNPAAIWPCLMVPRKGNIYKFPVELDKSIESVKLDNSDLSVLDALKADDTDGIIVIKNGIVKYEKYFGDFEANDLHMWASSTKSLTGMCAGILASEGKLDLNQKVKHYLPEMTGSAFENLTVQQVLNMVSALDYSEDYVDLKPGSVHAEYFERIGFTPPYNLMAIDPKKDNTPRGLMRFVSQIKTHPDKTVGEVYEYHSPNVDVIGLIISRISGQPLDKFVADRIWSKIGADHDAMFGADVDFNAIATGGFTTTLRDFAKFGCTVLNDGKFNGQQIFPSDFIDATFGLTREEFEAGQKSVYRTDTESPSYNKYLSGYKNFWWILDSEKQIMMAQGVFGQGIYLDKSNDLIIATFGSAPSASNAVRANWKTKVDAFVKISEYLK